MSEDLIHALLVGGAGLASWILKTMWDMLKDLQDRDDQLQEKLNRIELIVAGEYVKREEFQSVINRMFEKLDIISEKIDGKADR